LFTGRGQIYLISRLQTDKPFMVKTVTPDGAKAETGWCKTRSHCDGVIQDLIGSGYEYIDEIVLDEATPEQLAVLRLSHFHDAELRSALQKFIRRGMTDDAVSTAYLIVGSKNGDWWLRRRLSVICAEDIGIEWLERVTVLARDAENERDLLQLVGSMSMMPKTKAQSWLVEIAYLRKDGNTGYSQHSLTSALQSDDAIEACRIIWSAHDEGDFMGGPAPLVRVLSGMSEHLGGVVERQVDAAIERIKMKGSDWEEMYMAFGAVLAIIEKPTEPTADWPMYRVPEHIAPITTLPWFAFDQHTWRGKSAIRKKAEKHDLSEATLADMMFDFESAKVEPEIMTVWREIGLNEIAIHHGFGNGESFYEKWSRVQPDLQDYIEWMIARK